MGSFCEVTLSFHFRPDVPAEVLAAFASAAVTEADRVRLPALATREMDEEVAESFTEQTLESLRDSAPWQYDFGTWLGIAMEVGTFPAARLAWHQNYELWHFSARGSHKQEPSHTYGSLRWLGPYIHTPLAPHVDLLVGHIIWFAPKPYLLWLRGGRELVMEDLNPKDWEDLQYEEMKRHEAT